MRLRARGVPLRTRAAALVRRVALRGGEPSHAGPPVPQHAAEREHTALQETARDHAEICRLWVIHLVSTSHFYLNKFILLLI